MMTGTITNTLVIMGNEPDLNLANNTATQRTTVLPAADLSVSKSDSPDPLKMGGVLTYTILVTNNGPSPVTIAMLTDALPSSVILKSGAPSQGICSGSSIVTCNLGALSNGLTANVTIIVTPTQLGMITNVVSVTGNVADLYPANNTAVENTAIRTYVYLPIILK